jgi:exonuclease V gamma subunit
LRRFVADPVQYFFRQRLGIYLQSEDLTEDDEPFELSGLEAWQIKARLAGDRLAGRDDGIERLRAEGLLAHGHAADSQLDRIREDLSDSLQAIDEYAGIAKQVLPVRIDIDAGNRLQGSIADYYPGKGLMACHAGKFKGRYLLSLWIEHLAICAGGADAEIDFPSVLISQDKRWWIAALSAADARAQLADYCALYRRGLELPLPVFPEASYDRARATDRDKAVQSALRSWFNPRATGDNTNSYLKLVLQAGYRLPFDDPEFDVCARRLYAGLLDEASDR